MRKLCIFLLILLECFGLFLLLSLHSTNDNVVLVHILFRHGERSPSRSYTNDPYKDHAWPGGWDQLSTRGKLEEYQLGLALAKKYKGFLSSEYHQKDVLIQSSYADRCIMSAQLLLAGLFPPKGDQIWNRDLPWQPIPVHTIPRFIDNKIAIKQSCPKFSQALKEAYEECKVTIDTKNAELYDYLSSNTGDVVQNIATLETLFNTLEIQQLNNLSLPEWTKKVFPEKMKRLAALNLALYTKTDPMKRLHGGVLVKEILEQMNNKENNTLKPDRKMFLYSGHDLTVVTLLRVLGFQELLKPEFGAAVIIELHKIKEDFLVKFFYKDNPNTEMRELILETCGMNCSLKDLNNVLKDVIPENWDKECLL